MTSLDDIKLKMIGEPEDKKLPRGVYVIKLGDQLIFVRRFAGRLMPVAFEEQKELEKLLL